MAKKTWRERYQAMGKPTEAKEDQHAVQVTLQERTEGVYALVDLGWLYKVGLKAEAIDELMGRFAGIKGMTMLADRETGKPVASIGPSPNREGAEVLARGFLQMLTDTFGIRREGEGPQIRSVGDKDSAFVDYSTSRATSPKNFGGPPEDLADRITRAETIAEFGDDPLTLLLAAWARLKTEDGEAHPLRLIALARAVLEWTHNPPDKQSPLEMLESRARKLAQLVANNIPSSDEFILLLTNQGEGGYFTHIGSLTRETTVELLGAYVNNLKADQQRTQ